MLQLVPTQLTLARLVPGFPLPTRGVQLLAVLMMGWFADDANFAAQRMTSIMVALDVAWMLALISGNEVGVDGVGKTTYMATECDASRGHQPTSAEYTVRLPDGREGEW